MTICGTNICTGDEVYCCLNDDGYEDCCYYLYYHYWWFWFIWAMLLLIILTCSAACYRSCRARRHVQYIIVGQGEQPAYGTVISSTTSIHQGYGNPAPSAPVAPPAYMQKPPDYSPTQP